MLSNFKNQQVRKQNVGTYTQNIEELTILLSFPDGLAVVSGM